MTLRWIVGFLLCLPATAFAEQFSVDCRERSPGRINCDGQTGPGGYGGGGRGTGALAGFVNGLSDAANRQAAAAPDTHVVYVVPAQPAPAAPAQTRTKFCPIDGKAYPEWLKFCPEDGTELRWVDITLPASATSAKASSDAVPHLCHVDGERFPKDYSYCPKHGRKLHLSYPPYTEVK